MSTHLLKCWPEPFQAMVDGRKRFEYRRDDRGFAVGDRLELVEWFPETETTGRGWSCTVTYVLRGPSFGMRDGYVVMGVSRDVAYGGGDAIEVCLAPGGLGPDCIGGRHVPSCPKFKTASGGCDAGAFGPEMHAIGQPPAALQAAVLAEYRRRYGGQPTAQGMAPKGEQSAPKVATCEPWCGLPCPACPVGSPAIRICATFCSPACRDAGRPVGKVTP